MEPVILTSVDRATELWRKLEKHYRDKLAMLRAKNDNPKDEAETALIRGQIREVKEFLAIGNEKSVFEETVPRIDAAPQGENRSKFQ